MNMRNLTGKAAILSAAICAAVLPSYATPNALVHRWPFDINYSAETQANHLKAYNDVITGTAPVNRWGVCDGQKTAPLESVPGKLVLNGTGGWGAGSMAIWGPLGLTDATFEIWANNDTHVNNACMITYSDTGWNSTSPANEFGLQWCAGTTDISGLWVKSSNTDRFAAAGAFSPYTMGKEYYYAVTFHDKGDGSTDITWQRRDPMTGRLEKSGSGNAPNWTLGCVVDSATLNLAIYKQSSIGDARGTYNEVRVWNGVLSADQMAANACMGPDVIADSSVVGAGTSGFGLAPDAVFNVYEDFTTAGTVTLGAGSKIRFHESAVFTAAGFVLPSGTLDDYVDADRDRFYVEISGNVITVMEKTAAVSASWTANGVAGDVTDTANWNCVDLHGDPIVAVPSSVTAVTIAGSGLNLQAPADTPLDAASVTLGACSLGTDCDWRGFAVAPSLASGSMNLNGHRLYLSSVTAGASEAKFSGSGELWLDTPAGRSASFSSWLYKGYSAFKYGAGDLLVTGCMAVGYGGTTSFVHGGGTTTVNGWIVLGYYNNAAGRGTMTVTNGTVIVKDSIHMGYALNKDAYGTLNVGPGGIVNVDFSGKKLYFNNKNSVMNVYDGGKVIGTVRNNISGGVLTYSSSGGTIQGTFENNGQMVIRDCTTTMTKLQNLASKTMTITDATVATTLNNSGRLTTGGNVGLWSVEVDGNGVFAVGGNTALTGYLSIGHTSQNVGTCSVVNSTLSVADTLYVGFGGTGHLDVGSGGDVTATPAFGLQVKEGSLSVHDGGAASVRQLYRQGSGAVTVTFNDGVLKPTSDTTGTYATEFIKNLNDFNVGVGGMAIQTTGKNLGMKGCTVKVVPGGKITITGGGTFTFSNTTLRLTAKPTAGRCVFAETDGTLSGLPTFDDTFETGRQLKMSADGKCLYLAPRGFMIIVK